MQEKTLLKISLITTITGILILLFISLSIKDEEQPFQLIDNNNFVTISGNVEQISSINNVTFLRIRQNKPITAIIFEDYIQFKRGDFVELRGTVEEYEGQKELVVEEMRKY